MGEELLFCSICRTLKSSFDSSKEMKCRLFPWKTGSTAFGYSPSFLGSSKAKDIIHLIGLITQTKGKSQHEGISGSCASALSDAEKFLPKHCFHTALLGPVKLHWITTSPQCCISVNHVLSNHSKYPIFSSTHTGSFSSLWTVGYWQANIYSISHSSFFLILSLFLLLQLFLQQYKGKPRNYCPVL